MKEKKKRELKGFLGRKHFRIRFSDFNELLLSRKIFSKASNPLSDKLESVSFQIADLFPKFKSNKELSEYLSNEKITFLSRPTELVVDLISALSSEKLNASKTEQNIKDYYNSFLERRFEIIRDGDTICFKKCIEKLQIIKTEDLFIYKIEFYPKTMARILAENIRSRLELQYKLLKKLEGKINTPPPRIDYKKQLDFLIEFLEKRQKLTGEQYFTIETNDWLFRHAIAYASLPQGILTFLTPGTTNISDKLILPLFLETNSIIDISSIIINSDPKQIDDIKLAYYINKPSLNNIYNIISQGLTPQKRSEMTESQQLIYNDIYTKLNKAYIFGGRPKTEKSFAEICSWLIKKISFCLEDPSFLKKKAIQWLKDHKNDKKIKMEDDFFHPIIFEKLNDEFSDRIIQKPDKFGGYMDFLFDNIIPIELKVRKKNTSVFDELFLEENFKAGGQAAAYAPISRIAIILILDLPHSDAGLTNLNQCYKILTKTFNNNATFPTCLVAFSFHCHHPKPSSAKL